MAKPSLFRSLGHRNYRLYFAGQGLSLVGTWAQSTATPWLVYRVTGSPLMLGLVTFAGQAPAFFLAPLAGVVSDRVNRHRLLLVTQTLSMAQALALAALVLTDHVAVGYLLGLSLLLSAVNAFDLTTRQAFLHEMLDTRADLGNAIALNSTMFNSARLVGPLTAGVLIATVGEVGCFLVNAVSYLAVLAALLAMRLPPRPVPDAPHAPWLRGLREGVVYAFASPPIRTVLGLVAMVSLLVLPYTVLMPVFVRAVLHQGPLTQGILLAAPGVGALTASLYLASRRQAGAELLPRILHMPPLIGLGVVGFSFCGRAAPAAVALYFVGLTVLLLLASCNTLIQTVVADDKRGRVMSLYTMAFFGLGPAGSLLAGWAADHFGVLAALRGGGVGCLLIGLVVGLRARLRRAQAGELADCLTEGAFEANDPAGGQGPVPLPPR